MNRSRAPLVAAPSLLLLAVVLLAQRLDISRTVRGVIIGLAGVVFVAAIVLFAVWVKRGSS